MADRTTAPRAARTFTLPLVVRQATVVSTAPVTPRMLRVTLDGEELAALTRHGIAHPRWQTPGFDDHIKLILHASGDPRRAAEVLPEQTPHGIVWHADDARITRDYTPRRWSDGTFDLDFVLHGDGPAERWARNAEPGTPLWFVGPKQSTLLPQDLDWILLAGDETALPALGRFFEERPSRARAVVVASVSDPAARQEFALGPDDRVVWLSAAPGDRAVLAEAVRREAPREGAGYLWAAAEARQLIPVRRLAKRELGLGKDRSDIVGYWHARTLAGAEAPEEAATPGGPAGPAEAAAGPAASATEPERVPSPLPWLAVRAAVRSGLLDVLADSPGLRPAEAADRAGADPGTVRALLPALRRLGVVDGAGESLRLAEYGEEIVADEHVRERFDGYQGELLAALVDAGSVPEAPSPWQRRSGRTLAAQAAADAGLAAELAEGGEVLAHVAARHVRGVVTGGARADRADRVDAMAPGTDSDGDSRREVVPAPASAGDTALACQAVLAMSGPGTAGLLAVLPSGWPAVVVASGALAEILAQQAGEGTEITWTGDWRDVPAGIPAVLALEGVMRTDAELAAVLRSVPGDTAVLYERTEPDSLGPAEGTADLHALAATGTGVRDAGTLTGIAESVGWTVQRVEPLAWGVSALTLKRT
ncbi:SIP domain-containing protein [Sediminivirga luteola]|uniref:FAD-binding FR-type domain-containing protein n=1 Tax=Sediminivirga luteola TaxID=1774748 RepID=A0A8J2TXG0_9MICO|nr:SIP domain-containing protein [Sediminivirga luteola]MCI2266296.1 SIP domain-containing protein [Sediminivirga luteola]GGA12435.1 hypothetical protein GCM10011333_14110 [Sediminivirga luteola]